METQCSVCLRAAAQFVCSCAFPPVPVCPGCLVPHVMTAGTHTPTPIQKNTTPVIQVQGNEVCDGCHAKPALRFCLCAVPLRKYCEDCDIAHYRKAPLLNHSTHPLSAYTAVASGRVPLEAFKKKQQFINDFQLRLSQELVNFDAFVGQVCEKLDQLMAAVTTKKEAVLRDLQAQRATLAGCLQAAQQEIEAKRYADTFQVKTFLDDILLNGYQSAATLEVKMFEGKVDLQQVITLLEKAVTYSVSSDLSNQHDAQPIPVIKGNSVRLYDSSTLQVSQLTLNQTTRVDHTTAYCYIAKGTLLCCGGGYTNRDVHNEVYKVNIRRSIVVKVANMNSARSWLGIWKYKNECVYAFGGYSSAFLNTAEKYGLTTETWTNLRSNLQTAKYCCSVCEHANSLYISGVDNSRSYIEHFNPQTEAFTLLRSDNILFFSIMCSDGEGVFHIRQGTIEQANLTSGPTAATFYVKGTFPQIGLGLYWLCCPIKWNRGELTSVLNPGDIPTGLFRFNPAKSQFTQVVTLTY